jgi:hypothetical protein
MQQVYFEKSLNSDQSRYKEVAAFQATHTRDGDYHHLMPALIRVEAGKYDGDSCWKTYSSWHMIEAQQGATLHGSQVIRAAIKLFDELDFYAEADPPDGG